LGKQKVVQKMSILVLVNKAFSEFQKKKKKDDGLIKVAHCPPPQKSFELHQN